MTSYIGPVGSLIPVKCPSSLGVSGGRDVSFTRTLGRQKAFMGKVASRTWDAALSDATTPGQLAGLRWLADYGTAPFVWFGPDAVMRNMLDPAVGGLVGGTHSGLEGPMVEVEPDVWVKSAVPNGVSSVALPYRSGSLDPVPVMPGRPVTVSAWLRGSVSRIDIAWRNLAGAIVSSSAGTATARPSLQRASRTLTPPVGAVQMTITYFGDQVAGPAVSMTDRLNSYSPGKGCKRVVVHGLSEALVMATADVAYSSASFTITEVG